MKSTINFYYNLFPNDINDNGDFFYFWIDENKFYFVPLKNDKEVVMKIYKELIKQNKKINKIIFNRDKNFVTNYKDKEYVLIMINCIENEIVDLEEFINIILVMKPVDWGNVWERKIDYLEYQVSQRALGKDSILNSFSYYVGLAENAIQYYNSLDKNDAIVGVQHKRLYAYNYEINYYNPLNMIADYNIRDVAEYIKFSFFEGVFDIDKFINYINKMNLNNIMMNLLFVRLVFPTYYFDNYEKYINDEISEKDMIKIMSKVNQYELFLKKFYHYYKKNYNLVRIDWLF